VPIVARVALFVAGVALVLVALDSAVRTFVLPRGASVPFSRAVFSSVRKIFNGVTRPMHTYEARDRVMALYAPLVLLVLPVAWLGLILSGYMLMYRALDIDTWADAFRTSGSSLFTLGFLEPGDLPGVALSFSEAAFGLGILALLIAYLPTIYANFSRREVLVAQMGVRAGSPPSAVELLDRSFRIRRIDDLDAFWESWQTWFNEIEETHTSLSVLVFLRSPEPGRSWVTAAGTVLDAAALHLSVVDVRQSPDAGLCIRSGYLALGAITDFFDVERDADPSPDDPISITRDEFDDACRELGAAGVPLVGDREQAWRDFRGWRVNYDQSLLTLAGLVVAPYARWSSDRSLSYRRPRLRRRRPSWR